MSYIERILKHTHAYDEKTLAHAMRVATYTASSPFLPLENQDYAIALAIGHDLIEDTKIAVEDIESYDLQRGLTYLTKTKDQTYKEYCANIRDMADINWIGKCVYIVKLADMKDHLSLTETLTDKLKAKYLEGLAVLL